MMKMVVIKVIKLAMKIKDSKKSIKMKKNIVNKNTK